MLKRCTTYVHSVNNTIAKIEIFLMQQSRSRTLIYLKYIIFSQLYRVCVAVDSVKSGHQKPQPEVTAIVPVARRRFLFEQHLINLPPSVILTSLCFVKWTIKLSIVSLE